MDAVGLGDGSKMKSSSDIIADSGTSSGSRAAGPAPELESGKDAILAHAKSLSPSQRAAFYRSLATQGTDKAIAAANAGNQEQSNNFLEAANRFTIAASMAESMALTDDLEGKVSGGASSIKERVNSGGAAKGPRKKTEGVLVHHTGGRGLQAAIDTLKTRGLGYHYLVDRDGSTTEYVPGDQKAWHAGKTDKKPNFKNSNTVSIALVAKDDKDVTKSQLRSGFDLGQDLMKRFGASSVAGHGETSSHKHPEEGKTLANALRSGSMLKRADAGGIFEQDSNEISRKLDALNPNSLIAKLGKIPSVEENLTEPLDDSSGVDADLTPELLVMIETKLEKVLFALENNQSTHEKILKNSM
jgi:N-acetyl-anhydromuramyl-L-alanine amidase AmpD